MSCYKRKRHCYDYDCHPAPKEVCCKAISDCVSYNGDVYRAKYKDEWKDKCRNPKKHLFVLADSDARLDVYRALGLCIGDADVFRNVGGTVTDDAIRSVVASQKYNCTTEIMLVHVNDSLATAFSDEQLKNELLDSKCVKPEFAFETFCDVEQSLKQNAMRLLCNCFVEHKKCIKAFVYMVRDGYVGGNEYCAGDLVEVQLDCVYDKACEKKSFCKKESHHSKHDYYDDCCYSEDHYEEHYDCDEHCSTEEHECEEED